MNISTAPAARKNTSIFGCFLHWIHRSCSLLNAFQLWIDRQSFRRCGQFAQRLYLSQPRSGQWWQCKWVNMGQPNIKHSGSIWVLFHLACWYMLIKDYSPTLAGIIDISCATYPTSVAGSSGSQFSYVLLSHTAKCRAHGCPWWHTWHERNRWR